MVDPVLSCDTFAQRFFLTHSATGKFLVAYSGGLDSHVLLHLITALQQNYPTLSVRSVYIDHGLQALSADWAMHCQQVADGLGVEHQTLSLQLSPVAGESLEAMARKARYRALSEHLQPEEVLLTAHHQGDQAETVLLQLLRGAGLDGLAAMPDRQEFACGFHARPLLTYSRAILEDYAKRHHLATIDDPSNEDSRFERNFLRNEVIPLLKQHWPALDSTLSRVATFQAEASALLGLFVDTEMAALTGSKLATLSADAVNKLPDIKRKAVIRHWIKKAGFTAPSEIKLQHILSDVFQSRRDACPLVQWQGVEVRRYRDDVYLMSPLPDASSLMQKKPLTWDLQQPLEVGGWGQLLAEDLGALRRILLKHAIPVTVRFRQGGERLRPAGRQHALSLKKLLQEANMPPWQRKRLPLIYAKAGAKEQLICVPTVACIDPDELISVNELNKSQ